MKKVLSFVAVALLGLSTTFAQTAVPATTAAKKSAKKVEAKAATTAAKADVKATGAKAAAGTKAAANGLKKDGTPDMRLKENKAKAAAAGPVKKDGTPDMRYKANKKAAKKS